MLSAIKSAIEKLNLLSKTKPILVVSHFDTDGITSAAIFARALSRLGKKFSMKIVKNLEESIIRELPETHILVFLDLASNSFSSLKAKNTEIFIFDHHEIPDRNIPPNVTIINPLLFNEEQISGAAIAYLFAKSISEENKDLANLAVIGMVGDSLEKNLTRIYDEILKDSGATIKKGLLLYPSTRPLDKALEYSSSIYIPGVTGSSKGAFELLKDASIPRIDGKFKSLAELTDDEMSRLITSVMLRTISDKNHHEIIGNLYLIKIFNKLEDAREFSALINACSRMGRPEIALGFCLGSKKCIEQAERVYIEYKQHLISALKFVSENQAEKISGKDYAIINAKNNIKDTIIGTVTSMLSYSPNYETGTIIIALAYNQDKIKASARLVGKHGKNVREILAKAVVPIGGEVGGHPNAAGCLIARDKESLFIENLQKVLELPPVSQTANNLNPA